MSKTRPGARFVFLLLVVGVLVGCSAREDIRYKISHQYNVDDPQFRRSLGNLLGPPLVPGNSITSLRNGDEIFPAMLEAVRGAQHNINLETFIYWRGRIASDFTDALVERAKAGVKVHVIIDAIGSDGKKDDKAVRRMTDAGVRFEEYHPVAWYDPRTSSKLNHRTHRKLLVIDGRVGFTGGAGIADEWTGNAQDPDHWRDMHYRMEGPVVLQLQSAFCDNWMKTTGEVLDGADYFPETPKAGDSEAQVFKSGALGGSESMGLMFLLSIAASEKEIRLGTAYFVPDDLTVHALVDAAQRGVHVKIIVPGPHLDVKIVRPASRAQWGTLLQNGIEIYEYQPTMYHTKMLVVDDRWVSIGSANMDNRSFKLNDEANLNVYDESFAHTQAAVFDEDLKRCKQYTHKDWEHRPLWDRITEGFASLFAPLL